MKSTLHEALYTFSIKFLSFLPGIKHISDKFERKSKDAFLINNIYIYIQGVTGGMDETSGECSLC